MGFCLTWVIPAPAIRVLPDFMLSWPVLSEVRLSFILLADAESTDLYTCEARADAAAATPTPMSEPVRPICDWSKNEVIAASALAMTVENERSSKSFLSSPSSRLVSVVVMRAFAVSAKTASPSLGHVFPLRAGLCGRCLELMLLYLDDGCCERVSCDFTIYTRVHDRTPALSPLWGNDTFGQIVPLLAE